MKTFYLHGRLKKFGEKYRFDVFSPAEGIRFLLYQLKGFADELKVGSYKLIRGDLIKGECIDEKQLNFGFGKSCNEFHIVPIIQGSKGGGGGFIKVALGVAIIATAVIAAPAAGLGAAAFSIAGASITYGNIAMIGVALTFAGISTMLSPQVKPSSGTTSPDQRASYLFSGIQNVAQQGVAVPLIYGKVRTGSIVVNTGVSVEEVSA